MYVEETMSEQSRSAIRTFLPATISIVLVAGLRLLPLAFPQARLWGMDSFLYLDTVIIVLSTLLLLAFALPPVQSRIAAEMEVRDDRRWSTRSKILAGLLFAAALFFPMRTVFYGDGGSLVIEVYKLGAIDGYSSAMLLNLKSAPLAGALLYSIALGIPAVMHAIGMARPDSVMFPFYVVSLIGVVVLYLIVLRLRGKRERFITLALLVGSGSAVLFFSHAEMYLAVTLAIAAFLIAGQRALRGESSLTAVSLLFVIAVLSHYMALALLPALLFVLLRGRGLAGRLAGGGRALLPTWIASIGLIALLYWLLGFATSDSRIVMPLYDVTTAAGTLSYTLLSAAHLMDFGNILLLLDAVPLLFLLISPLVSRGGESSAEQRFLLIALLYFGTFIFFANTSLGLARDWDIAAPLGVILVLLVPHTRTAIVSGARRSVVAVVACASIASVLPWIIVNVDEQAAARRFEVVMRLDEERMYGDYALSGYEALRKHYMHHRRLVDEDRILKRMVDVVGYPEQYRMLLVNAFTRFPVDPNASMATQFWVLDRLQRAAERLTLTTQQRSYAISRWEIDSLVATVAAEAISNSTMKAVFGPVQALMNRSGLKLGHDILMGTGWYLDERFPEACEALRSAWESRFRDPRVDGMYASALTLAGLTDVGDAVFIEASRWHRTNPRFLLAYATTQIQLQRNHGQALTALRQALALNPSDATRDVLNEMLASIPETQPLPLPWSSDQPILKGQ